MAKKDKKNQQGVILLLSLVIMAVLLSAAITFAFFILSDLKQAKLVDSSIIAYYGAETGMEKSLFLLRKSDATTTDVIIDDLGGRATNQILGNNAQWNINSSTDYEAIFFRQRLANGQAAKVFFLDRATTKVKSIGILWHANSSATKAKVTVDFSQLNPQVANDSNALVYLTDQSRIFEATGESDQPKCLVFNDKDVNSVNGSPLSPLSDYMVNVKILDGIGSEVIVDDLQIKAYDSSVCDSNDNVPTSAPPSDPNAISNLTLRSDGFYNGTRQEIVAQIPPRDPVSGVLDFVLFSEADITKGY